MSEHSIFEGGGNYKIIYRRLSEEAKKLFTSKIKNCCKYEDDLYAMPYEIMNDCMKGGW